MVLKKKFFDVELEVLGIKVPILSRDTESLIGQVIRYDLTKFLRGKNCEAKFKVVKSEDGVLGQIYFFMIEPSFIKKMIGRNISIIEDSFTVKCTDCTLRIKPFLITRRKVSRRIRNSLRNESRDFIGKRFTDQTKIQAYQDILSSDLQKMLSKNLKKIYPLAVCEIRMANVESKN
jgi:ribosomal protein S3AE